MMKQSSMVIGSSLGAIASGLVATATTFCCIGPAVIAVLGEQQIERERGEVVSQRLDRRILFLVENLAIAVAGVARLRSHRRGRRLGRRSLLVAP